VTLERLEALARDVVKSMKGQPDQWRGLVGIVAEHLPAALPHFTPATAAELEAMFAHDVGTGPTDPDPGF